MDDSAPHGPLADRSSADYGHDAAEAAARKRPPVIILDQEMPTMTGVQLVSLLRRLARFVDARDDARPARARHG